MNISTFRDIMHIKLVSSYDSSMTNHHLLGGGAYTYLRGVPPITAYGSIQQQKL